MVPFPNPLTRFQTTQKDYQTTQRRITIDTHIQRTITHPETNSRAQTPSKHEHPSKFQKRRTIQSDPMTRFQNPSTDHIIQTNPSPHNLNYLPAISQQCESVIWRRIPVTDHRLSRDTFFFRSFLPINSNCIVLYCTMSILYYECIVLYCIVLWVYCIMSVLYRIVLWVYCIKSILYYECIVLWVECIVL